MQNIASFIFSLIDSQSDILRNYIRNIYNVNLNSKLLQLINLFMIFYKLIKNIYVTSITLIAVTNLHSCGYTNYNTCELGTIPLALYRPVDFNGHEVVYIDTEKTCRGVSNVDAKYGNVDLSVESKGNSISVAVKNAIKHEGQNCLGLANVKVTIHRCMIKNAPCIVEGNPVYRKD